MRAARAIVAAVLAIAVSWPVTPSAAVDLCGVPTGFFQDESPLLNTAIALKRDRKLKIVVLGSSSSLGSGGTGPDASWPARLQAHLSRQLPDTEIQVVNRSVAGQGTRQMARRITADVLPERPALVIWQTGTADAARSVELDQFMTSILFGVDKMAGANIDVMLMDPQFSRLTARVINFQPYVDALGQVAGMRDLVLVPRYAIMRYWTEEGLYSFDDVPRERAARMADQIYDCLGEIVATVIATKVK